jgi:hypothetical protein
MEPQLWKAVVGLLAESGKPRFDPREDFTDHEIVRVWYWAVIHDRPKTWALCHRHWPPHLRRGLVSWGGGLTGLPAWVRTHRRVHRWVQAKLVLSALKQQLRQTTCAA